MASPSCIIITPVRNEEACLAQTIRSMVDQTVRPAEWIVVDDGSTDATARMIDEAAARHSWITAVHRPDRGFRKSGGGVIEAFYDGYSRIQSAAWDFLIKFDGDLAFERDYFERCLARFQADERLGIGGGLVCGLVDGVLREEVRGDPSFHVRGATKIYRRACWEQIGGLVRAPGWDTIDEVKANMLGWTTTTFRDIRLHQLKATGSADGSWRNWVKNGRANYITGYHPVFMAAKCVRRFFRPPRVTAALGLAYGFLSGYLTGLAQVDDRALIRYLRQQQMNRLRLRPSIWD